MRLLYNLIMLLAGLMSLPFWMLTLVKPKRRETFRQRLGWQQLPFDSGRQRPIWIHALSVGEVTSAVPIDDRLRCQLPGYRLVFSTSTLTGFQTAQRLVAHQVDGLFYYPYDLVFSVHHAIGRVDPGLVVIVETDIWPNFLHRLKRFGVPAILANARISAASFRGYRLLGGIMAEALASFACIAAQSRQDALRLVRQRGRYMQEAVPVGVGAMAPSASRGR